MPANGRNVVHSAEASALGFYYQTFYALLALLGQDTDDAAVAIEQLDDVDLKVDGQTLLIQLKHSLLAAPPPIALKSRALWRTLKVWIDALPKVNLSETTFYLVSVAGIDDKSGLMALTSLNADRNSLAKAMVNEAQGVVEARAAATSAKKRQLPHADRVDGCEAFLALSETERLNLLRRIVIKQGSPSVEKIEELIAKHLKILPPDKRAPVAERLVEWWDRQVVYSLCGKRDRLLSRAELQEQVSVAIADLEQGKLLAEFEGASAPEDYQPHGMLARQIGLVRGTRSDLSKAIREEWRAREQRSKWMNENPAMAVKIGDHDRVLREHWSDQHSQMVEECNAVEDDVKCEMGLKILRWTHDTAPGVVRPIASGWNAPYYVRGSYQVLAISLEVGWHPEYAVRLGGTK
ncbi:MAG: ABC-three component system protein [Polyangiaceae bacterium]